MNIVQGNGNTVFSHLVNPGPFKACPGKLHTFRRDSRGDRDLTLHPAGRIPGIKGLNIEIAKGTVCLGLKRTSCSNTVQSSSDYPAPDTSVIPICRHFFEMPDQTGTVRLIRSLSEESTRLSGKTSG